MKKPRRSRAKFLARACRVASNGKPIETIPQLVAQRAGELAQKAPLQGSGAKWVMCCHTGLAPLGSPQRLTAPRR